MYTLGHTLHIMIATTSLSLRKTRRTNLEARRAAPSLPSMVLSGPSGRGSAYGSPYWPPKTIDGTISALEERGYK
jgi:hypothetical protein